MCNLQNVNIYMCVWLCISILSLSLSLARGQHVLLSNQKWPLPPLQQHFHFTLKVIGPIGAILTLWGVYRLIKLNVHTIYMYIYIYTYTYIYTHIYIYTVCILKDSHLDIFEKWNFTLHTLTGYPPITLRAQFRTSR